MASLLPEITATLILSHPLSLSVLLGAGRLRESERDKSAPQSRSNILDVLLLLCCLGLLLVVKPAQTNTLIGPDIILSVCLGLSKLDKNYIYNIRFRIHEGN